MTARSDAGRLSDRPSAPIAPCPHRPPCPGCPRYGHDGIASEAYEKLSTLCAAAGLPAPQVVEGAATGYRHRARLAVRGRAASPKVGIFQQGTHRIVDIPRCVVHHRAINRTAAALQAAVRDTGTAPYADASHRGLLRYLQVVVERASGRVQVVLVANSREPDSLAALARALAGRLGDDLHSLWWNGNAERTNTILGPLWHRITGEPAVCERVGGVSVYFPPSAFGQSNLELADRLVDLVRSWVEDDADVAELYAGCGPIGLGLLGRCRAVTFNEIASGSLEGLQMGLAALPPVLRARARVIPGPAAAAIAWCRDADMVIADPPRKGLDRQVLAALCAAPPRRFIFVSCGLEAFLAQARTLRDGGALELRALTVFALLPFTEQVETVALFERTG